MIDKQKILEILNKESVSENSSNNNRVIIEQDFEIIADEIVKLFAIPVVMQSCDTCKHLSTCRFWQEAPNNGATCKFYIKHVA
jgi:hypothetical protein